MPKIDVNKTELVWVGKYDEEGKLKPVEKPGPYPFQIVEVINKPRTGKEQPQPTLFEIYEGKEGNTFEEGWRNKLIWGDNKLVMSSLLERFAGKINLIYIDPPFATGADFRFKIQVGEKAEEITKEHSIIEEKAYYDTWGKGLDSYLQMMYERLVLTRELLAENGSIYVHLDWHVGHYVKVMMDEIFGYENFQREIVWALETASGFKSIADNWIRQHDIILFYSKTDNLVFLSGTDIVSRVRVGYEGSVVFGRQLGLVVLNPNFVANHSIAEVMAKDFKQTCKDESYHLLAAIEFKFIAILLSARYQGEIEKDFCKLSLAIEKKHARSVYMVIFNRCRHEQAFVNSLDRISRENPNVRGLYIESVLRPERKYYINYMNNWKRRLRYKHDNSGNN